jgi:hypothetical protein
MADRGQGRRTVLDTTRRLRSTPTDTTWKPFWEAWVSAAHDVAPYGPEPIVTSMGVALPVASFANEPLREWSVPVLRGRRSRLDKRHCARWPGPIVRAPTRAR